MVGAVRDGSMCRSTLGRLVGAVRVDRAVRLGCVASRIVELVVQGQGCVRKPFGRGDPDRPRRGRGRAAGGGGGGAARATVRG